MNRKTVFVITSCLWICIWVVYGIPKVHAEQTWFFYYSLAKTQIKKGMYGPALVSLQRAVRLNPKPQKRARTYGMNFIAYYPYYYMAKALYHLEKYKEAKAKIEKSFEYGAILEDSKMAAEASALKESILNKLELLHPPQPKKPPPVEPKPVEHEQRAESSPPSTPMDRTEKSPPPPFRPKPFFIPRPVLKQALSLYETHQYRQTIRYLSSYLKENPGRPAVLAYFLIGLSYANLYFLGGEADPELLVKAVNAFKKARPLPAFVKKNLQSMVSPKILKIYNEAG